MPPAYLKPLSSINALWRWWLIARSRIFDAEWYKANYPDVTDDWDCISHYLQKGASQRRRPHLLFDPAWYELARGSKRRDANPLIDYILYGAADGVEPSPYFSTPFYRKISGGTGRLTPLGHFVACGSSRGLAPTPLFDRRWYLDNNPDVRRAGLDPFLHFVASGAKEGRSPSPLFDSAWYRMKNADARDEGCEPLHHYLLLGAVEGRKPSPAFDADFFVASALNQGAMRETALASYAAQERKEWRSTHPILPPPASATAYFEALPWRRMQAKENAPEAPFRVVIIDVNGEAKPRPNTVDRHLRILAALPGLDVHLVTDALREVTPEEVAVIDLAHPDLAGIDHRMVLDRLLRALRFRDPGGLVVEAACAITPLAAICAELQVPHHDLAAHAPGSAAEWVDILARKANYRLVPEPTISVIVPNFNHARWLDERIASILAQRRAPDEIIFLDDCSSDESLLRARAWRAKSPIPFSILANEANSGSPFQQWAKGIERARGDLIWIAESDDWSSPRFLEQMAPLFIDPQVTMAYCDSEVIGADGEILSRSYRFYTDSLSEKKWLTAYVNRGEQEIAEALAIKNTIPNVSAALFRRATLAGCIDSLPSFSYCGDWWTYVNVLRGGKIAYRPQALNKHRQHVSNGVTQTGEREIRAVEEAIAIKLTAFNARQCDASIIWTSIAQTVFEYEIRSKSVAIGRPSFVKNKDLATSIEKLALFLAKRGHKYPDDDGRLAAFVRGLAVDSIILQQSEREEFVHLVLRQVRALRTAAT